MQSGPTDVVTSFVPRLQAVSTLQTADVVVVGGGLSGSLAALVLERLGYSVVLVDRWAEHPPEFRVEKIAGDQVELLRRLGLLECIADASTYFDRIINASRGRLIDTTYGPHYGIFYHDLVNLVRAKLRPSSTVIGRVTEIRTGSHQQQVIVADRGTVEARLVILATGMSDPLRRSLGITRKTVFEKHSISFGFNVAPAVGSTFTFGALTYYGEALSNRIDYMNLFPIGEVMRANLFTFRDYQDEWLRTIRQAPERTLLATMPGLDCFTGRLQVIDKVQNWTMDLYRAENYVRDGIVLIGDAFQTSCPAAGTGVSRLLTDVQQLCLVHVPRWLTSPGMTSPKIAQFYADPVKQAADARSAYLANYRRSLTLDESLKWQAHRRQLYFRRRIVGWIKDFRIQPPRPMRAAAARVPLLLRRQAVRLRND